MTMTDVGIAAAIRDEFLYKLIESDAWRNSGNIVETAQSELDRASTFTREQLEAEALSHYFWCLVRYVKKLTPVAYSQLLAANTTAHLPTDDRITCLGPDQRAKIVDDMKAEFWTDHEKVPVAPARRNARDFQRIYTSALRYIVDHPDLTMRDLRGF
jgi:hypothetical protein